MGVRLDDVIAGLPEYNETKLLNGGFNLSLLDQTYYNRVDKVAKCCRCGFHAAEILWCSKQWIAVWEQRRTRAGSSTTSWGGRQMLHR